MAAFFIFADAEGTDLVYERVYFDAGTILRQLAGSNAGGFRVAMRPQ